MRRRHRTVTLFALLCSLALLAAACNGEADFGGEAPDEPAEDEEAAAPEAEDEVETDPEAEDGPDLTEPPEITGDVIEEDLGEHTINFGIGLSDTSPQYLAVEYFRDILDHRTDGRIQVEIFPDSQVGDDNEMMRGLQTGTLEMTFPSTSPAATIVGELAVFDLPFLFPTEEDADQVLDSDIGQGMLDDFDGTGINALAWAENGYRQLTNSQRAVESPEDVDGLRLRVMENEVQVDIWDALGASPTSMAFGEVFSALEQGVVDGQENPWSTILTSNFHEVQGYGTESRHVYTPFIMMIGQDFFDGLDEQYQAVIEEAAEQTKDYQRIINREYQEWSRDRLEEEGMEISVLSDEQLAEFQEATQPVYDTWAPEIGEDLVEEIQQMIDEG